MGAGHGGEQGIGESSDQDGWEQGMGKEGDEDSREWGEHGMGRAGNRWEKRMEGAGTKRESRD